MKDKSHKKTTVIITVIVVVVLALAAFLILYFTKLQYAHIDSFEECIGDQPYLTIASAECTTPDGRTFIRGEN